MSTYHYSIQGDFPNDVVATDRLTQEIQQAPIVTALDHIDTAGDDCAVFFKAALSAGDETLLSSIVAAHDGIPLPQNVPAPVQLYAGTGQPAPKTSDGKPFAVSWPTEGSRSTFITPSWCDKRTWYQKSVRVVDEVATVVTPTLVYAASHVAIIDTYHGRISGEDYLKDAFGNSFRVIVKVNGATKVEQDPHTETGGDYTIDYLFGRATFLSPLGVLDEVKLTYHYANGSEWTMAPAAGKILKIASVEAQFAADIILTDTVLFQAYGFVDVFAPQLMPGVPSGTKIPLGDPNTYKTMMDFINEANRSHPQILALGGAGWRGCSQAISPYEWDYKAITDLFSSKGMELRIKLQHDVPFGGYIATATLYCLSVPE
jgi:hypothetical protein